MKKRKQPIKKFRRITKLRQMFYLRAARRQTCKPSKIQGKRTMLKWPAKMRSSLETKRKEYKRLL